MVEPLALTQHLQVRFLAGVPTLRGPTDTIPGYEPGDAGSTPAEGTLLLGVSGLPRIFALLVQWTRPPSPKGKIQVRFLGKALHPVSQTDTTQPSEGWGPGSTPGWGTVALV